MKVFLGMNIKLTIIFSGKHLTSLRFDINLNPRAYLYYMLFFLFSEKTFFSFHLLPAVSPHAHEESFFSLAHLIRAYYLTMQTRGASISFSACREHDLFFGQFSSVHCFVTIFSYRLLEITLV